MNEASELFEPGEYLDARGPGLFTVGIKPGGTWRQSSYELQLLPQVVKLADPKIDTFISQGVFQKPGHSYVNLQSIGLFFADLDVYNAPHLRNRSPEEQAKLLAGFCLEEGIPVPSIVLFSGRGLQAKWLFTEAMGAIAVPAWNEAERALVSLLEPFAADRAVNDVSRLLRLDQTVNTKSGEICRVVFTSSGRETVLARYDFEELYECLVDRLLDEPRPAPKPQASRTRPRVVSPGKMTTTRLNWFRLYDIRDLWQARGGVPVGYRELTLFWELNFLLHADPPARKGDVWHAAQGLASEIDSGNGWYRNSDLSTVFRKAKEMRDGHVVQFRGQLYRPLYTPKNQYLIDLFKITPQEEQSLRTIISQTEKYRRKVEKRRDEGMRPQPYRDNKPWEELGISRAWYYRRYRRE